MQNFFCPVLVQDRGELIHHEDVVFNLLDELLRRTGKKLHQKSACGLGVLVGTDKHILAAGGFLVQLLPGAPEELIQKIEDNIFMMDQLTTILNEDGAEEVLHQVLRGLEPEILARDEVNYRCYCSRERIESALQSAGDETLQELASEGPSTEVTCQFCGKQYVFTPEELLALQTGAGSES